MPFISDCFTPAAGIFNPLSAAQTDARLPWVLPIAGVPKALAMAQLAVAAPQVTLKSTVLPLLNRLLPGSSSPPGSSMLPVAHQPGAHGRRTCQSSPKSANNTEDSDVGIVMSGSKVF